MSRNLEPILRKLERLAIELGGQLARPAWYVARLDCIRLEFIDRWLELDSVMFELPGWEAIARREIEAALKPAPQDGPYR
ncbi:MAG TPA: hypothetical protein VM580_25975 [Labilithrix sp.]|jgi:hypothetical protein|nr:hypothetical protein [Labilithrix sp.]